MKPTGRVLGRAVGVRGEELDAVYHVTLARNLPSIAESGLVASRGMEEGAGRGAYSTWSRGKVFLTAAKGVHFWHTVLEQRANDESDDMAEDRAVPVVLRVRNLRRLLHDDTVAVSEGAKGAYYVRRRIPPRQIEVFDGERWMPVSDYADDDTVDAYVFEHLESEEDVDGETFWSLRDRIVFGKHGSRKIPSTIPADLYPR